MARGARDAGTKTDQPSDREGMAGGSGKNAMEADQAAQDLAQQETSPEQPAGAPKEKSDPQAEGTAAAVTGVDKPAAEEGVREVEPESAPGPTPVAKARKRARKAGEPAVVVRAKARYVRTAPRKARLVADHVRGKSVDEARAILAFSPRAAAEDWRKLLESAIANAENNHDLVGDDLIVLSATADDGPTLKRFRPRAMGRATRIRKRTSHLTIQLTPKES